MRLRGSRVHTHGGVRETALLIPPVLTCSKNDEEARFSLDKASKTFYVYLFVVFSSASFFHVSFLLRLQFGSEPKGVVIVVVVVTEDGNADGSFFRFF